MAATGKVTYRLLSPIRWITSTRNLEVGAEVSVENIEMPKAAPSSCDSLSSLPQKKQAVKQPPPQVDTVTKFRNILRDHVLKISQTTKSPSRTPAKKVIKQSHSTQPSQGFADAMLELHSSVNQFYGLQQEEASVAVISKDISNMEMSTNTPTPTPSMREIANIDSKKLRIRAAKAASMSIIETNQRMKGLSINVVAPGISAASRIIRIRELCDHARNHPSSRLVAVQQGVIPYLLTLQKKNDRLKLRGLAETKRLCGTINEALAVLGHHPKINTKGIKILSIDGGGTRGLVAIETLKQIEIMCQAPIHTLFDYICGVSTGGLLAVLVGPMKMPLDRCEAVYKECSQRIFSRGTLAGAANLLTRHCYYDMSVWEGILQDEIGADRTMLSTSRDLQSPRVGLVSTVMSEIPYNYVFRNYNHDVATTSQYPGSCSAKVWEAIRASSAAPGYFEDFKLGQHVHQDGGVLNNNPTAIALHEARALWPDEEVQCVVSVGNGRYEPTNANAIQDVSSLRHKVGTLIHSATNTEAVHTVLNDLLPAETYFRFNPYMSEEFLLNEIQEDKLQQMQFDTQLYLRRNASKLNTVGQQLKMKSGPQKLLNDWLSQKYSWIVGNKSKNKA